jgi:uncharacterized protein (TIGR02145 family)
MKLFFVCAILFFSAGITRAQNTLKTIKIGKQTWMVNNLDAARYRNGDPIPKVSSKAEWAVLTTGAWCYYDDDSVTYATIYGKLYNWYAVNDPRGLAPKGWHIPTEVEWTSLISFLGADSANGKLKVTGTTYWKYNKDATNTSGFTAYPGGYRDYFGSMANMAYNGYWWSSTKASAGSSYCRLLEFRQAKITASAFNNNCGLSVRCIRD